MMGGEWNRPKVKSNGGVLFNYGTSGLVQQRLQTCHVVSITLMYIPEISGLNLGRGADYSENFG